MKTIVRTVLALMLLSTPILAANLVNVAGASHIAIEGYDPVAFFIDAKAEKGSPSISATYLGAVYFFASDDHKQLFTESPDKYVPQFGGFCAFAVSRDALAPVDISTWQVRNGKLYLNFDHNVLKRFNADFEGNVSKADANWIGLVQKNGR